MITTHTLGYPRIGQRRELKAACESYWAGRTTLDDLVAAGRNLRRAHWQAQREAGIDLIPCNDFSFYDQVLDTALALGCVPERFAPLEGRPDCDLGFAMARGHQRDGLDITAMAMTKWFDTNYHFIVPEFTASQTFTPRPGKAIEEYTEARSLGIAAKPVLIGPLTFLLLGKERGSGFHRLDLLDRLLPAYGEWLRALAAAGADWVQIDEPYLVTDLDGRTREAYQQAFRHLRETVPTLKILLATYFGDLGDNMALATRLPVDALHLDLVRAPDQLDRCIAFAPPALQLSLGVVDGRNVWKTDLGQALHLTARAAEHGGLDRVMLAPSCSLLHVPYDLALEPDEALPLDVRSWLAFARQKIDEVVLIARLASPATHAAVAPRLVEQTVALERRRASSRTRNDVVRARSAAIVPSGLRRAQSFAQRKRIQDERLGLPLFPTTTIGSFPQSAEVRRLRARRNRGEITDAQHDEAIATHIADVIRWQDTIGMDVLVHGEFERNDMVQYFAEQLDGCASTEHGWVQSYGSRCTRPPIIYGDVARRGAMTVRWSAYAQSLTAKPVKGMVTGPVTILQWSFVRDDQPRHATAQQIALAIRDEVTDLERAGIRVIQIDEPALREGLPLRHAEQRTYLGWAVEAFRLASAGAGDATQIHTHMCYAEFNDIVADIAAMDADVITIEASRSDMALLNAFRTFAYPNDVGPGVYDVHSPRVPGSAEIVAHLERALDVVPAERLWVNPDCGLKTRSWAEVRPAIENMIAAARALRARY